MSVGRVQLRMSVGLHSGTVQLFRAGRLHHELIVTGPAATRTTQMEHAASAGQIFVSPEMAERLPPGATKPGPSGTHELRWRRAPVTPTGPRLRLVTSPSRWTPAFRRSWRAPARRRRGVRAPDRRRCLPLVPRGGRGPGLRGVRRDWRGPGRGDQCRAGRGGPGGRRLPCHRHRRRWRQGHPGERRPPGAGRPRRPVAAGRAGHRGLGTAASAPDRRQRWPRVRRHDRCHPSRDVHGDG